MLLLLMNAPTSLQPLDMSRNKVDMLQFSRKPLFHQFLQESSPIQMIPSEWGLLWQTRRALCFRPGHPA
ncbi:hypothetical protein [Novacetimonas hansenii]|uniref:Uncharacterized protein n=1 Tax=Novacetimonas hansenii TaxID=436 RepID=A0AAW5ENQ1_NOVHA|nr:hypothetical protein [Novacetimonas hansenii]MCJ8352478.1 hypothetical protein [Novacetimonas hansenii]